MRHSCAVPTPQVRAYAYILYILLSVCVYTLLFSPSVCVSILHSRACDLLARTRIYNRVTRASFVFNSWRRLCVRALSFRVAVCMLPERAWTGRSRSGKHHRRGQTISTRLLSRVSLRLRYLAFFSACIFCKHKIGREREAATALG